MRSLLALALVASVAGAQDRALAVEDTDYLLRVRAVDTTKQATMSIAYDGRIFGSLGGTPAAYAVVDLAGNRGTGRGTLVGSLRARPGRLTFSVAEGDPELELTITPLASSAKPLFLVRGRVLTISYSRDVGLAVAQKP
jgi:hypothetical protein